MVDAWRQECQEAIEAIQDRLDSSTEPMVIAIMIAPKRDADKMDMITSTPDIPPEPIPIILMCPICGARHIDKGEFATKDHHTHACQSCGHCWRPAIVATVGVQFLPGFKDE